MARRKPPTDSGTFVLGLFAAILFATAGYVTCVATPGCATRGDVAAIKTEVGEVKTEIAAVRIATGRDINEPVTSWILAGGYAAAPIGLLIYMLAHRSRVFRALKSRLRGGK